MFRQVDNEQRKFPRVEVQLKVDIKTTYVYTTASVINISEKGLFIRTQNPLPVGSELEITLYFPKLERDLKFVGVVRWIRSESTSDIPSGMGVELLEGNPEALSLLKAQIQKTPKNF